MKRLLSSAVRVAAQHGGPVSRELFKLARRYSLIYDNCNDDPRTNGEYWLLSQLGSFDPRIIFDVGANGGEWSVRCARLFPSAMVHSFEIVPQAAGRLKSRIIGIPNVAVNHFGLSDFNGEAWVYVRRERDRSSSDGPGVGVIHGVASARVSGRTVIGDTYLEERGIDQIDILKIDVEGAEDRVLKGFACALADRRITVIQFEYGHWNIFSHFLLLDFYRLLEPLGFMLGKLYADGVAFKRWDAAAENFHGPKYVAVHSDRRDIIDAIRSKRAQS
jgi:FkbM family methyltransferase